LWEYNGKLSIYNSCPDKEWPPSKAMLVSDAVIHMFSMTGRLTASRRDIIRFQNGAPQMISVEEENREKRNPEQSAKTSVEFASDNTSLHSSKRKRTSETSEYDDSATK
jgi:hypothetical protein